MKNTLSYKGYTGTLEYSEGDGLLFGKVLWIKDVILYEGHDIAELKADFHDAVDDYLALCEEQGISPDVPCKGSFNVRVSPELHQKVALIAVHSGKTLNACVTEALEAYAMR